MDQGHPGERHQRGLSLRHFTDAQVEDALRGADLEAALREAFIALRQGRASQQARVRTEAGGVKLSTLGGVLPGSGFAGAKVYTTIAGEFRFVIVLFSAVTGEPLATFDAGAITRRRTAAVSLLAAQRFASPEATRLALFGTGVQARAHLEAFAAAFPLRSVAVVSRRASSDFLSQMQSGIPCALEATDARAALRGAHLVVTATRSAVPLFDGRDVEPGAFVAAVGSSKPDARELDDALLARSRAIVVEWREQTLREAGDLVLAHPAALAKVPIVELGDALAREDLALRSEGDVVIFKSVGVGIEDVAAAGLAWMRLTDGRT